MSDDADNQAAEYVLGTLSDEERRNIAARAETDPALRAAIAWWEERLAPLANVPPVAPPPALWRRISVSAGLPAGAPDPAWRRTWRNVTLWRATTAVGFALAAAFAAIAWLHTAPQHPVAALVPYGSQAAAYIAQLQPDGSLRLTALRPVSVASGKDLELWALPPGATRPVALGVLPASVRVPATIPGDGTQLMISLEPAGGSPTGLPTGPVLYAGTLKVADR